VIDPSQISCCLITKEDRYPKEILPSIFNWPWGEVLILTHCESPHLKQELFAKAKFEYCYYQDDDCIAPIDMLLPAAVPGIINCAMKPTHLRAYANSRIALIGWGSIFPKSTIEVLDLYRAEYGEDFLYKRETERIMTWFAFPQNRLELPIVDLPSAMAPDRLSMQPGHYQYIPQVEQRCAAIEAKNRIAV
jgi:hypothetical protein